MNDIPEIDIRNELLPRHSSVIEALYRLSKQVPIENWVLVGGLMVLVLGREHDGQSPRAEGTKDADVLVDIVANSAVLETVTHALLGQGFDLASDFGSSNQDWGRCTFVFGRAQIDVLCPDDADINALDTKDGLRSLAIPGGRRALQTARHVELYFSDNSPNVRLRVPSLAGAIVTKGAAATDKRTAFSSRHIQDLAFLFALSPRPLNLLDELTEDDLKMLKLLDSRIHDNRDSAWEYLDSQQRDLAQAAYDLIVGKY